MTDLTKDQEAPMFNVIHSNRWTLKNDDAGMYLDLGTGECLHLNDPEECQELINALFSAKCFLKSTATQ